MMVIHSTVMLQRMGDGIAIYPVGLKHIYDKITKKWLNV